VCVAFVSTCFQGANYPQRWTNLRRTVDCPPALLRWASAIYNATGVRVRDYLITLDKLIAKMPQV